MTVVAHGWNTPATTSLLQQRYLALQRYSASHRHSRAKGGNPGRVTVHGEAVLCIHHGWQPSSNLYVRVTSNPGSGQGITISARSKDSPGSMESEREIFVVRLRSDCEKHRGTRFMNTFLPASARHAAAKKYSCFLHGKRRGRSRRGCDQPPVPECSRHRRPS